MAVDYAEWEQAAKHNKKAKLEQGQSRKEAQCMLKPVLVRPGAKTLEHKMKGAGVNKGAMVHGFCALRTPETF